MKASFIRGVFCLCCLLSIGTTALADHASFSDDGPMPIFSSDYLVSEQAEAPVILTMTFAGDCTLGGTESANRKADGFVKTTLKKGLEYPFSGLLPLFSEDDITLVNLEGVLSDDSRGENKDKEFAFRGPAAFAQMLPLGSVEAVNLANNHALDYGVTGQAATIAALEESGIAYAGDSYLCIYESNGIKVGLGGIKGSLSQGKQDIIKKQINLLRQAGCQVIVYSLHAGQEYAENHNNLQKDMARFLIDAGADAVIGHHPHVVQGMEIYQNRPIFYSLGNCVFGGNHDPKQAGALVVQIAFTLENHDLKSLEITLHPILITLNSRHNDFCPQPAQKKKAGAILESIQADTSFPLPPFEDGKGVLLPPIIIPSRAAEDSIE